jgi:hypothetical protein
MNGPYTMGDPHDDSPLVLVRRTAMTRGEFFQRVALALGLSALLPYLARPQPYTSYRLFYAYNLPADHPETWANVDFSWRQWQS